jgi:hypothetical protein
VPVVGAFSPIRRCWGGGAALEVAAAGAVTIFGSAPREDAMAPAGTETIAAERIRTADSLSGLDDSLDWCFIFLLFLFFLLPSPTPQMIPDKRHLATRER